MSFNYSKGAQVIGDLKAADDAQRDTKIDFGEDQIDFHTSGSMKMQIANDGITTTLPIHISGSAIEGLRLAKGGSDYRAIVFEVDGADNANISVSNAENFVIQNEMNGKDIQFWVNPSAGSSVQAMTIKESGLIGIGTDAPDYELDVAGNIGVNQYIYHNGDANTWINFTDNRIRLNAGGNNFIDCEDPGSAPHKVRINNGGNNIDFVIKDSSGNVYFTADASTAKIGIGTDTPSHKLDVDGDIRVRGNDIRDNSGNPAISFDGSANTTVVNVLEVSGTVTTISGNMDLDPSGSGVVVFKGNATKGAGQFKLNCETNSHGITIKGPPHSAAATYTLTLPNDDGNNGQVLQTDGSGVLSWANQTGGGLTKTLNTLTGATGDVNHDCSNSSFFQHTSIAGNFTPNFTNLGMQNNQVVEGGLILTQGGTGYLPNNFKVDSTGSAIYWEGTAMPTASTNGTDTVDLKITRVSDSYNVFARFSTTSYVAAQGGGGAFSIPNGAMLFLDASDANSWGATVGQWTDLSGQGNHATQQGTPTFDSTDKLFDMGSGDFFTLPSGFADFTGGATWFFIADFGTSNNWERILDFSVGGQTDHAFNVGRQGSSTNVAMQYYKVAEDNTTQVFNSNQIENDTLICFCFTTDGTYAKAYKNGSLAETINFAYTLSNTTRTQNYIARSRANTSQDLRGKLAVVGIWGRALSASEVTSLFDHYDTIYSL